MPKFKTIQLFPNNDHTCLNQFPSFIDSGKVAKILERVFIHQWSPRKLQLLMIGSFTSQMKMLVGLILAVNGYCLRVVEAFQVHLKPGWRLLAARAFSRSPLLNCVQGPAFMSRNSGACHAYSGCCSRYCCA